MIHTHTIHSVIVGQIIFETIINNHGRIFYDEPGGSALYAASGFNIWHKHGGILAKIGEDKPIKWKKKFEQVGLDTSGIITVPRSFDQRRFYVIDPSGKIEYDNPQKHFFEREKPLPKYLLGYTPPQASRTITRSADASSITSEDIPKAYANATNVLISPMDLYSHNMLPPFYRSKSNGSVAICGSDTYMKPSYWFDFPPLVRGSNIFLSTVDQIEHLFLGKTKDIWDMITFVANCGVEIVCIFNPDGNHLLFDKPAKKRYEIPHYPTQIVDPVGNYATFCGGFFGGYTNHFDPIYASKAASVSASLKSEGSTPFYPMGVLNELAKARLETLHENTIVI